MSKPVKKQEPNIQKLGNITFDSNKSRKLEDGTIVVKDIKTGKDFGVVRNTDGSYDWYVPNSGTYIPTVTDQKIPNRPTMGDTEGVEYANEVFSKNGILPNQSAVSQRMANRLYKAITPKNTLEYNLDGKSVARVVSGYDRFDDKNYVDKLDKGFNRGNIKTANEKYKDQINQAFLLHKNKDAKFAFHTSEIPDVSKLEDLNAYQKALLLRGYAQYSKEQGNPFLTDKKLEYLTASLSDPSVIEASQKHIDYFQNKGTINNDSNYGSRSVEEEDGLKMFLGLPTSGKTYEISKNKPSISKDSNATYYKYKNRKLDEVVLNAGKNLNVGDKVVAVEDNDVSEKLFSQMTDETSGAISNLGHFTISKGKDDKGEYVSYYDKYDLNPKGLTNNVNLIGKPFEVYNKIYLNEKFQKGGVSELGYKKNSPYKNRKSLNINSNFITTENMSFPILAISDMGDTKILYPDTGEYKFKGNMVKEYKLQKGGKKVSKVSPETSQEKHQRYIRENQLRTTEDIPALDAIMSLHPVSNVISFLSKENHTPMDYVSLLPGERMASGLSKVAKGLPTKQAAKVLRTSKFVKSLDTIDPLVPFMDDFQHYQKGGKNIQQVRYKDQPISFDSNMAVPKTLNGKPIANEFIVQDENSLMFYPVSRNANGSYQIGITEFPSFTPNSELIGGMGFSHKSKSKERFKEKQEGGVQLSEYLESLSPEDQDRFVEEYENAPDKDDFMMKCGGRKRHQDGGYYFTKGVFQLGGQNSVPQVPEQYANSEVEGGETVLSEGLLKEVEGPKHSEGGVPTILQEGDQVFSEYLMVPDEVKKAVLGKNTKKKYTFAELSKKFDTKPNFEILEDIDSDEYERNHAELKLQTNTAMLQTLFTAQEMAKENEKPMKTSYKTGGMYQAGGRYQNTGNTYDRFQKQVDGSLYDPQTGNYYNRLDDGSYEYAQPILKDNNTGIYPSSFNPLNPTNETSQPKSSQAQPKPQVNGRVPEQFIYPWPKQEAEPGLASDGNLYQVDGSIKDGIVKPVGTYSTPQLPTLSKPKSSIRRQAETKVSGKPVSTNVDNAPNPDDPWNTSLNTLPGLEFSPVASDRGAPTLPPDSHLIPVTNTTSVKQSWYQRNKDKFGVNSKLAGTILDIGLTLSDKLRVNEPMLYDHQKQPMFNRFYEFDNKEVQRLANQQIQGIMNSNLPEAVKQAQIAEVTANSQDNQGRVDFANAQRYEGKREQDLSKLQTYQDANVDSRISDFDNYRQRKAKVDYLRDKFKAQKKERVVNSARNYLDYASELQVTNDLSEHFTINPITGKTKIKPNRKSNLQNTLLQQYAQNQGNTSTLPNGATATQIGNLLIVTDPTGKSEIKEIK